MNIETSARQCDFSFERASFTTKGMLRSSDVRQMLLYMDMLISDLRQL
jgi:hypothetical protein